jgi:NADPH-dependent 2,4-dienoyl-CoA reductase/sulfur reductase-like enzyme
MFLRCVGSEPGRLNDGQNGALRSIRSRSSLRRSPANLWPQESEARVELTRPRRTELGFAHQVVDLGEQLRRPIRLTDKTAIIRNLGATGLCLSRSNHEEHIAPPCVDLSREIHTVQWPHVMVLRSLQDCRRILAEAISGTRVAVVGGSFIAMEAAASLIGRVLSLDVIAPEEHPLEKVFGRELSDLVLEAHSRKGVRLHLGAKVARIEDKQVALQGGERIDADLVVVGIGVEPRLQLAEAAGLALDRGVLVNSWLQTSDPDIFAAGDIARWPDPHTGESIRVEHWVVAERQGQIAAANMLGGDQPFVMVPFFWTKHFDLSIRYVGHAEKWDETLVEGDLAHRNGLVRFRRAGRDLAVATVERDKDSLRAELAMEGESQRSS